MKTFTKTQSVGEIVAKFPGAAELFKKYRIDFCCGGSRSLGQVIDEAGIDEDLMLETLDKEYAQRLNEPVDAIDFLNLSRSGLIDHIESTHHVYMKKNLPEIAGYAAKILEIHGTSHKELRKVYKLYRTLKTELSRHLEKEEQLLFPMIKRFDNEPSKELLAKINKVIYELETEHVKAGDLLKELRRISDGYKAPDDGCATYDLTYYKLEEMENDLFSHIHLENNILFISFLSH